MMTTKLHPEMRAWQYRSLLGQLDQIQLHAESGDCPCIMKDLDPPEYCLAKHCLSVSTLSAETAAMDEGNRDMLMELADSAIEMHEKVKQFMCHKEDLPDLVPWARGWRKKLEAIYYNQSCKIASLHQEPTVCSFLNSALVDESQAGEKYREVAFAARHEHMGDVAHTLSGIARTEDSHFHKIEKLVEKNCQGVISQEIEEGAVMEKTKLPVCTPTQRESREQCIPDLKARNREVGCSREEGTGSKKCPSPFAVCTKAMGCRLGRAKELVA